MHYLNKAFLPFFFLIYSSCYFDNNIVTNRGNELGTFYTIKYERNNINPLEFQNGIDSIFFEINNSLSTYIKKSDISRINDGDSLIKVDKHFRKVFKKSKEIWAVTNGYFDPTVGSLVNAYGFGPEQTIIKIDSFVLDSLMDGVGMNKIKITSDYRVIKRHPQTYIDFNAIAKGYTVDCIYDYLISLGNKNFLIEIGGEIRAKGFNPSTQKKWKIGISVPEKDKGKKFIQTYEIGDYAMATSGNYNKFRIDSLTGEKFVHSVNPINGLAFDSNILSVSVIAPSCIVADAFATALMVMPLENGKKIVQENQKIDANWVISRKNELVQIKSSGWN